MRIIVLTPCFYPSIERKDLPLVAALRERGHEVIHAAATDRIKDFRFPGYPESFHDDQAFIQSGTVWADTVLEIFGLIDRAEVLVVGMAKGIKNVVKYARLTGKKVVQYQDANNIELYHWNPDLFCVAGPWQKEKLLKAVSLPENKIRVTGCVKFDSGCPDCLQQMPREAFCRKYNLDPAKKTAVWLPGGPAVQNPYAQKLYRNVVGIIEKTPGFQVIIKGHPNDYSGHKRSLNYQNAATPSWEVLTPGVPACLPEDALQCYCFCDVGISSLSSVAMEFPLFKKPFIYVNAAEAMLPPEIAEIVKLPRPAAGRSRRQHLTVHENVVKIAGLGVSMPTNHVKLRQEAEDIEFIGLDCTDDSLQEILTTGAYEYTDDEVYDDYVKKYFYKNDGKAHLRIADAVEECMAKASPEKNIPRRIAAFLRQKRKKRYLSS